MKTFLAIILLLPSTVFAQFNLQTSGTSQRLNGIDFYSDAEGWAVGVSGTVLHTVDSGKTWNAVQVGATESLNAVAYGYLPDVDFYDPLAVNIVGASGAFYGTRDGLTWYSSSIPGSPTLNAVEFTSPAVGYVAGNLGMLYRSTDSGHTWKKLTTPSTANFYGMYWYDDVSGWVLGAAGTALYTEDAGASWYKEPLNTTGDLRAMSYGDDLTAWIVGKNVVIKTIDDASSFTIRPVQYDLYDVAALSATSAFAVGAGGNIYATTNGTIWQLAPSVTTNNLTGIVSPEGDDIFISGDAGTIISTIESTHSRVNAHSSDACVTLHAYPNPAVASIRIETSDRSASIRIFNAAGLQIAAMPVSEGSLLLDVSSWPAGVYQLVETSGGSLGTARFIVQH